MPAFNSEEMRRYWRSYEALDPVFKYLGLRKKLQLAQINSDLQSIAHGWLGRHQQKLVIITKLSFEYAMKFRPSSTLSVNPYSNHLPSCLLKLFSRLSILNLIHADHIYSLLRTIEHMGGDFKTAENMESSGLKEIDEWGYKYFKSLMESNVNLKRIQLNLSVEQGQNEKSFAIECGHGVVSLINIPTSFGANKAANFHVRDRPQFALKGRTSAQLKIEMRHPWWYALEDLEICMNNDEQISDEELESFCDAIKESTCDRLTSVILSFCPYIRQFQVWRLLKSISDRWSNLKRLTIRSEGHWSTLSDELLSKIIRQFPKLETLKLLRIVCRPFTNQTLFSPANSIKQLKLQPYTPVIPFLFPSLRILNILDVNVSDLHQLESIKGEILNADLETLEVNMLDFINSDGNCPLPSSEDIDKAFHCFRRLLRSFPKLKSLQVLYLLVKEKKHIPRLCNIISEECPHLEKLTLKNTSDGGFEPTSFMKVIPRLRYLAIGPWDLNCVTSFRDLVENSPKLRSLRISPDSDAGYNKEIQSLIDKRRQQDPDFVTFDW